MIQTPIWRLIMTRHRRPVPETLMPLQQQFEQFRVNAPTDEAARGLWESAAELAKQHGLYATAHALRLDYVGLKRRIGGSAWRRKKPAQPRFVELIASTPPKLDECVIEFESACGAKMRMQWKAATPPDWASLLRVTATIRTSGRVASFVDVTLA